MNLVPTLVLLLPPPLAAQVRVEFSFLSGQKRGMAVLLSGLLSTVMLLLEASHPRFRCRTPALLKKENSNVLFSPGLLSQVYIVSRKSKC